MNRWSTRLLCLVPLLFSCAPDVLGGASWEDEDFLEIPVDRDYLKPLLREVPATRSLGLEFKGPQSGGIDSATEVWPVRNRWYQISDEAGLAWGASSGLTWDEKYAAWVDSLEKTAAETGQDTVMLTTPWGREIPSPALECAEMAMFLRATFAAWYELPFFITAWHADTGALHYGHFGVVDSSGKRVRGTPTFALSYDDHTAAFAGKSNADVLAAWPHDTKLQERALTLQKDDRVDFVDGWAGAYFDEVHLNKRVGWFLLRLLTNFGSIHLVSPENTFDIEPRSMREGDVLVERWQSQGIGHVMVLKEVEAQDADTFNVEIVFGSMPRIQPRWYDPGRSKSYFVTQLSGGWEESPEGVSYAALKGGLKRWRTPVEKDGRWMNIVPVKDRDGYIGDTDYAALGARVDTFGQILGQLSPTEERDILLTRISESRANLQNRPASCANRQRREEAFDTLYALAESDLGMSRREVDRQHREIDDYVFAELAYADSKTCCWNASTRGMYDLVMLYNQQLMADAEANDECVAPEVFKAKNGGYELWSDFAESLGRGAEWVAWSEDEPCPAARVEEDREAEASWTAWCEVSEDVGTSATGTSDSATSGDPCRGIDWIGTCDGDTVVWCDDNALQEHECGSGETCGWSDYYSYWWCL